MSRKATCSTTACARIGAGSRGVRSGGWGRVALAPLFAAPFDGTFDDIRAASEAGVRD